jgi:sulfite reductase (ferredoxin)
MIKPLKTYILPSNLEDEINHLHETVEKFKRGEVSPTEFKVQRVPFGCYEQRKHDTYMVRIRNAGSVVTPEQLKKIAEISKVHAADYIHLTTRQEIQLHYVLIDSIVPVVRELKTVGLSPRGGGGNTIRNIMAQEDAGIARDEVFDVSPYAIALTSRFVAEPDSWNLPRKFKIAFSGSSDDRGYATIHDVGFIAKMKDGQKGFRVFLAGGLGAKPQLAIPVHDFIPESEVYQVAKAAKTLFYKNGNRKNKHAARLRFVLKALGEEEFKRKYFEELDAVRKAGYPPLDVQDIDNSGADLTLPVEAVADKADFQLWKKRFVQPQKQEGLYCVILPAHLGHVDNDAAIALAEFLTPFGNNTIRIRKDQNFLLRNIPEKYLTNLYNVLKATFDNFNRPFIIDKIIACAGASTCQLGICLSPGAATAIKRTLEHVDFDLDAASDARINISGCPNSCGQHHVGHIGFFGKVARKGDKVIPAYNVMAGGKVKEGETELAQKVGEIASRDVPNLVRDALKRYVTKKDRHVNFEEYTRSEEGRQDLKEICDSYKTDNDAELEKNYYFDWGTDKIFSVAERGKGECSAGIFDLIESDFGHIQTAKKLLEEIAQSGGTDGQRQQLLKNIIYYSTRVLLVSRALEPKSEQEAYNFFREYFINAGLVDASFNELIKIAESNDYQGLLAKHAQVYALADRVQFLYDVMDPGFNFKLPEGQGQVPAGKVEMTKSQVTPTQTSVQGEQMKTAVSQGHVVKDFRGVGCPMNFVKTKMELAKLKPRDILEVWLDDGQPIQNVPGSVRDEGHKILKQVKVDDHWSVLIEKQ